MVGLSGFEPLTSRLSAVRSNQLSYRPVVALEGREHVLCGESRMGFQEQRAARRRPRVAP